jgi:hypothetical protein
MQLFNHLKIDFSIGCDIKITPLKKILQYVQNDRVGDVILPVNLRIRDQFVAELRYSLTYSYPYLPYPSAFLEHSSTMVNQAVENCIFV